MKKLLVVLVLMISFMLSGCTIGKNTDVELDPVEDGVCVDISQVSFYASTVKTAVGTKDIVMMETNFGDIEVTQKTYEYTELDVYSHLCFDIIDNVATEFVSARLKDLAIPEPVTIYEDVIEYVDVPGETIYVDVPGPTEYIEVPVEYVEVVVHTHDLIDPEVWVAIDHEVYYYYVQEGLVHLVYTKTNTTEQLFDMYLITISFDPNLVFSDQAMVSSLTYFTADGVVGSEKYSEGYIDTEFSTMPLYIEDFILTHTFADIEAEYNGS